MHAVVVKTKIDESARDPEFTILRRQVIPAVKELPGFDSGCWLASVDGVSLAVVVFESEDAARQAADGMGVKPGGSLTPGTTV